MNIEYKIRTSASPSTIRSADQRPVASRRSLSYNFNRNGRTTRVAGAAADDSTRHIVARIDLAKANRAGANTMTSGAWQPLCKAVKTLKRIALDADQKEFSLVTDALIHVGEDDMSEKATCLWSAIEDAEKDAVAACRSRVSRSNNGQDFPLIRGHYF